MDEPRSPVSMNTRVTLSILVVTIPLFVWAGRLDNRVDTLEKERAELHLELRDIKSKLDDIRERIPLKRPRIEAD
jgi:hypothetical protein